MPKLATRSGAPISSATARARLTTRSDGSLSEKAQVILGTPSTAVER